MPDRQETREAREGLMRTELVNPERAHERASRQVMSNQEAQEYVACFREALAERDRLVAEVTAANERYELMVGEARKVNRAWRDERDRADRLAAKVDTLTEALRDYDSTLAQAIEELVQRDDTDFFWADRVADARAVFIALRRKHAALASGVPADEALCPTCRGSRWLDENGNPSVAGRSDSQECLDCSGVPADEETT